MQVMKTYKYKLYRNHKTRFLDRQIDTAASVWNYCIAMRRRYYKLYHKDLPANALKKHITKIKRQKHYAFWNALGSQAIQDVVERVDRSYKAFFKHIAEKQAG